MTLVLIQYQHHNEQIVCLSDTRVTADQKTVSDYVTKILPITARAHKRNSAYNIESTDIISTDYGFAFSGSTLAALSIYSWSSAILNNMIPHSSFPTERPDGVGINAVACVVRDVADRVFYYTCEKNSGSNNNNESDLLKSHSFEILLFGFDPVSNQFIVHEITPSFDKDSRRPIAVYKMATLNESQDIRTFAIGSKSFKERYDAATAKSQSTTLEGLFKEVFTDNNVKTVGGSVMGGIATKNRFMVLPIQFEPESDNEAEFFIMGEPYSRAVLDHFILAGLAMPIQWD